MGINLCKMTKELAREYHREFQNDPDVFMDMDRFSPYVYSEQSSDAKYERQIRLGREYLAILMNDTIIGQIIFKEIDRTRRCCTLSIHLKNDSVKNQRFGTQAEKLALAYAFDNMGMDTVTRMPFLKANAVSTFCRRLDLNTRTVKGYFVTSNAAKTYGKKDHP